ncbi:NusG domain II-containing protein [Texcoconibacillus texcoconensis]|uniref:NusG domain-containing protein n=1 Tax=Texcoconibacillus texcoconensis TaxID=1095777 RepID=A0A840QR04_9BACI|nr:NusG domain II-containing protein [Texcoconibacillus texcoconensis]MBB5173727.1 hypothetical protein [Texcoconibacillus texcoconensis]
MKVFHMFKFWDWIIIPLIILLSFLPSVVFTYQQGSVSADSNLEAVVSVDNEEIERIPLTGHEGNEILDIPEVPCDTNTVQLQDEQIRIQSSDCPDQVCVLTGFISTPGETIVCLHHRVVIEIEAEDGHVENEILSY